MAPFFKKHMYFCWKNSGSEATMGLIGFTSSFSKDPTFAFRNALFSFLNRGGDFYEHKIEGRPTRFDSQFMLFDKDKKYAIEEFLKKKRPGFFRIFFQIQRFIKWRAEYDTLLSAAKVELETSHDFPCLIVTSYIHSPRELSEAVQSVAKQLSLEMHENKSLEDINNVIMSNRVFDV